MPDQPGRSPSRLAPSPAWTVLTDAPLLGLGLAREAGTILVWDEADGLYLLDTRGRHRSVSRAPGRVIAGAISDDGTLVALLGEGSRLWLLGPDFGMTVDRQGPPEASSLAVDPHGRYVAVASRLGLTQIYNRYGRPAGRFETRQPLAHLCFIPDRPFLLGAAAYGTLAGINLAAAGHLGRLEARVLWQESLMSNVGRLATSGDGGLILASCFTHGVQRYDLRGQNEGSYHLGGTAAFAVPDFPGRTIGVATLEGELAVLSPGGNVRWKSGLIRPAIALETDPLGRFLIYGHATGEVVRLDLDGAERPASDASPEPAASRPSQVRIPPQARLDRRGGRDGGPGRDRRPDRARRPPEDRPDLRHQPAPDLHRRGARPGQGPRDPRGRADRADGTGMDRGGHRSADRPLSTRGGTRRSGRPEPGRDHPPGDPPRFVRARHRPGTRPTRQGHPPRADGSGSVRSNRPSKTSRSAPTGSWP
jgi:hypothetical protein